MLVKNGERTFQIITNYVAHKVQVVDTATQVAFYLPLAIAFTYERIPHAKISV